MSNLAKGTFQLENDDESKDLLSLEVCFLLNVFTGGGETLCFDSCDIFKNKIHPLLHHYHIWGVATGNHNY